jgi:hypothetical protein
MQSPNVKKGLVLFDPDKGHFKRVRLKFVTPSGVAAVTCEGNVFYGLNLWTGRLLPNRFINFNSAKNFISINENNIIRKTLGNKEKCKAVDLCYHAWLKSGYAADIPFVFSIPIVRGVIEDV